jgi:hypothetical protein
MHVLRADDLPPRAKVSCVRIWQKLKLSWAWQRCPVILALRSQKQEDFEFKASPGYTVRPCLKQKIIIIKRWLPYFFFNLQIVKHKVLWV